MSELMGYQSGILYGPINSRRLGTSLGINLLPAGKKTCNFNCLYCQYGWTETDPSVETGFSSVSEVVDALQEWKDDGRTTPDSLTFSGNGEPTLYPHFAEIVDEVIRFRDKEYPETVVSILSNSTRIVKPDIRKAIAKIDNAILKLDSGTDEMMKHYNGPNFKMDIGKTVEAISGLENVILQSLFSKGANGNLKKDYIENWLNMVEIANPRWVMLYTLHRGFPADGIEQARREELEDIQKQLESREIKARVF